MSHSALFIPRSTLTCSSVISSLKTSMFCLILAGSVLLGMTTTPRTAVRKWRSTWAGEQSNSKEIATTAAQDPLHLAHVEVGESYAPDEALLDQILHSGPHCHNVGLQILHEEALVVKRVCVLVIAVVDGAGGEVDEVHVQVVQPQPGQRLEEESLHCLRLHPILGQLAQDEEIAPGHLPLGHLGLDYTPKGFLLVVQEGGVKVPVSRLQGYMDSLGELLIAHLVDAQTYLRQVIPGVQLKGRTAHSMLGWSGGYPQQSCSQTFFQEIFQIWLNFS